MTVSHTFAFAAPADHVAHRHEHAHARPAGEHDLHAAALHKLGDDRHDHAHTHYGEAARDHHPRR